MLLPENMGMAAHGAILLVSDHVLTESDRPEVRGFNTREPGGGITNSRRQRIPFKDGRQLELPESCGTGGSVAHDDIRIGRVAVQISPSDRSPLATGGNDVSTEISYRVGLFGDGRERRIDLHDGQAAGGDIAPQNLLTRTSWCDVLSHERLPLRVGVPLSVGVGNPVVHLSGFVIDLPQQTGSTHAIPEEDVVIPVRIDVADCLRMPARSHTLRNATRIDDRAVLEKPESAIVSPMEQNVRIAIPIEVTDPG